MAVELRRSIDECRPALPARQKFHGHHVEITHGMCVKETDMAAERKQRL
jgi:hypothetical protein